MRSRTTGLRANCGRCEPRLLNDPTALSGASSQRFWPRSEMGCHDMVGLSPSTRTNLIEQGFGGLDEEAKALYAAPLRFTPAVGTALIVVGLALRSPVWLGSMSLVALTGGLLPRAMVLDLVYNFGVRHLSHAPPLPPTPRPRRFSYLLSSVLLAGSAFSFHAGLTASGLILGGLVATGGAILTASLWCLGSWFYRRIFRQAVDDSALIH